MMRSHNSDRTSSDAPQAGSIVPSVALLENWAHFDWTDGCQVDELVSFQPLTVVTRNHIYEIIVLDGREGRVRLRGGQFFPEWREVHLAGCSLGGSFLKLRGVYAGFGMEFHVDGEVVVTSPVQRLTLARFDMTARH